MRECKPLICKSCKSGWESSIHNDPWWNQSLLVFSFPVLCCCFHVIHRNSVALLFCQKKYIFSFVFFAVVAFPRAVSQFLSLSLCSISRPGGIYYFAEAPSLDIYLSILVYVMLSESLGWIKPLHDIMNLREVILTKTIVISTALNWVSYGSENKKQNKMIKWLPMERTPWIDGICIQSCYFVLILHVSYCRDPHGFPLVQSHIFSYRNTVMIMIRARCVCLLCKGHVITRGASRSVVQKSHLP